MRGEAVLALSSVQWVWPRRPPMFIACASCEKVIKMKILIQSFGGGPEILNLCNALWTTHRVVMSTSYCPQFTEKEKKEK